MHANIHYQTLQSIIQGFSYRDLIAQSGIWNLNLRFCAWYRNPSINPTRLSVWYPEFAYIYDLSRYTYTVDCGAHKIWFQWLYTFAEIRHVNLYNKNIANSLLNALINRRKFWMLANDTTTFSQSSSFCRISTLHYISDFSFFRIFKINCLL